MRVSKQRNACLATLLLFGFSVGASARDECVTIRVRAAGKSTATFRSADSTAAESSPHNIELRSGSESVRAEDREKQPPKGPRFSATRILDLEFRVRFTQQLQGEHLLRLDLITPKGHRYESLTAAISTDPGLRGASRKVADYPRPLAVQFVGRHGQSRARRATLRLPVAGTPIVSNSLYGAWKVEAYLDEGDVACAKSPFTLKP